jgi:hypothetical protein
MVLLMDVHVDVLIAHLRSLEKSGNSVTKLAFATLCIVPAHEL